MNTLWCQTPQAREKRSTALADLELKKPDQSRNHNGTVHTFIRSDRAIPPIFSVGETVLVSSDAELVLSQGVVLEAGQGAVTVGLDRMLRDCDVRYHLDRYEYQGQGGVVNLAKLLEDSPQAGRLRSLIIDR